MAEMQVRSMKRARDIRDQLEGLLERVEIEATSNPNDLDKIRKAITSGTFFKIMSCHSICFSSYASGSAIIC